MYYSVISIQCYYLVSKKWLKYQRNCSLIWSIQIQGKFHKSKNWFDVEHCKEWQISTTVVNHIDSKYNGLFDYTQTVANPAVVAEWLEQ